MAGSAGPGVLYGEVSAGWTPDAAVALVLFHGYGANEQDLAPLVGGPDEGQVGVAERGAPFEVVVDQVVGQSQYMDPILPRSSTVGGRGFDRPTAS